MGASVARKILIAAVCALGLVPSPAAPPPAPAVNGSYLGQVPPGPTPVVFAPGLVSMAGRFEFAVSWSPDGRTLLFSTERSGQNPEVLISELKGEGWTSPQPIRFRKGIPGGEQEAFFSPDGREVFFAFVEKDACSIWKVFRTSSGWGEPVKLGAAVNTGIVFYPTRGQSGTLYFTDVRKGATYRSFLDDGEYKTAQPAGLLFGGHAFVAPDEKFLLFDAEGDLFVAFRGTSGGWGIPRKLRAPISTAEFFETCPSLSPDGKYLFWSRYDEPGGLSNIYWAEATILKELELEEEMEPLAIAQAVDDAIGWFKTKDFDLLFRVHSPGPDLFMFQPESTDTITSGEAFRKFAEIFRDPALTYSRHQVKELRINRSGLDDVAWFSALLDDCSKRNGREGCWKDVRWTGVLERREGRWVMVQGHFSFAADPEKTDPSPAEAQAGAAQARDSLTPSGKYPEIESVIRAGLAWARNKDQDLLFSTRAQDETLLIVTPYSLKPVVGINAFKQRAESLWLTDDFKALGYDIRDLRIHLSPRGTVAWFSALVDDWCEYRGQPQGWKDVRWTGVLEKRGGKWLYVQGHFSFAADRAKPPAGGMEKTADR